MDLRSKRALLDHLGGYLTQNRKENIDQKLEFRTRFITVALEDIYNSHNASAVIRTCDCFGIQDLHVVEERNKYDVNPGVAMGSSKWVDLHRYEQQSGNIEKCVTDLKNEGFTIVATSPDSKYPSIKDYEIKSPIALLFGTELEGLTEEAINLSDEFVRIPMYGFTESFNISVSAALCLYELTDRLHQSDHQWQLDENEQLDLKLSWYRKSIKRANDIEKEFLLNN